MATEDRVFGNRLFNLRYERGEITPSIEVARKVADALEPTERDRILSVMDSLVRDAKAHHAYRMSA